MTFSTEQMKNLSSIVWLYRGENERFLGLVQDYLKTAREEAQSCQFNDYIDALNKAVTYLEKHADCKDLKTAISKLEDDVSEFEDTKSKLQKESAEIDSLTSGLEEKQAIAEQARTVIKGIEHTVKLVQTVHEAVTTAGEKAGEGKKHLSAISEASIPLTGDPDQSLEVTGGLKRLRYFASQAHWLVSRFPEGVFTPVEGLVKLVDREEVADNDYSLTPGRFVGVAPEIEDEDFNFDEVFKSIHEEIESLNDEAAILADRIKKNYMDIVV